VQQKIISSPTTVDVSAQKDQLLSEVAAFKGSNPIRTPQLDAILTECELTAS
jgi:hypothetical protein